MSDLRLARVRLPIPWRKFGFDPSWGADGTVVADGRVAWAWEGTAPDFGVGGFTPEPAPPADGWGVDHVVLLVPAMDAAVTELQAAGAELRMRMDVKDRATSFFRVGTILEVIETGVPVPGLYGVALRTTEPLEEVAARWRAAGHECTEPRPAIQPDRRIFTVQGLDAGLAVMDWPGRLAGGG